MDRDQMNSHPYDRDELGRVVRTAWIAWAKTQPDPKPSWLAPYDDLSEPDKEADRQIGEAVVRATRTDSNPDPGDCGGPPETPIPDVAEEFERLCSDPRLSEGEWRAEFFFAHNTDPKDGVWFVEHGPADDKSDCYDVFEHATEADCRLMAFAKNRGPELLARLRAAERERDAALACAIKFRAYYENEEGSLGRGDDPAEMASEVAKETAIPLATVRRAAGLDVDPPTAGS